MAKTSLHDLPRFDSKLTYLYVEHAVVEQQDSAIAVHRADGSTTAIPAAALAVLLLGPGTTLTHAAVKSLAEKGITHLLESGFVESLATQTRRTLRDN